jgi:hypothetical protein
MMVRFEATADRPQTSDKATSVGKNALPADDRWCVIRITRAGIQVGYKF